VFINTGTRAAMPDVPGLNDARPMTNIEALELDTLLQHLIVLGGGYVGLELVQTFCRFGGRVTVVEHGRQITPREDADVAALLRALLMVTDQHIASVAPAKREAHLPVG
jgi:pyruvate/2-oxoglutarate dehydrogenase complex dihydrolipoamide dehydrogenase (E3) component